MNGTVLTAIFWILFGVCLLGLLAVFQMGMKSGPSGGAVGAWLLVIPVVLLAGLGVVFATAKSDGVRVACVGLLALPLLAAGSELVMDPIRKRTADADYQRAVSGADSFRDPAQLGLAAAIRAGDVEKVKALLPAAGDLNKLHGEKTLFLYALERGQGSPETRLAVVKLLLGAGANPNVPAGAPLRAVSFRGREMVELLLEHGADVNHGDPGGEPYWWMWLDDDANGDMVSLMLEHGANLQLRVHGYGPVSHAAHRQSWKTMLLLMEAGAPYKGEPSAYVGTLYQDVANAVKMRPYGETVVPAELVKAMAMMEAGAR